MSEDSIIISRNPTDCESIVLDRVVQLLPHAQFHNNLIVFTDGQYEAQRERK